MGQLHARMLTQVPNVHLYAGMEADAQTRAKVVDEFAVPHVLADAHDALALTSGNVVVIASNSPPSCTRRATRSVRIAAVAKKLMHRVSRDENVLTLLMVVHELPPINDLLGLTRLHQVRRQHRR
jgi:hypothetical protein